MSIRTSIELASAALAAAVLAGAAAGGASAAATSLPQISGGKVILDFQPHHIQPLLATGSTSVRRFSTTVNDGGSSFKVTMVGKNPFVVQTAPSTTIKTFLVPVKIVLPNGDTFDPTVTTPCDTQAAAVTRTLQSPIVASRAYSLGGTALGTGQYTDIFRRAEFFKQTSPTGINPGYHVKLSTVTLPTQTVRVPSTAAAEFTTTTPCGEKTGAMDITFWDNLVTGTLLPSLRAQGATEATLPIFELRGVVLFDGSPSACCILGYHSFAATAAGKQTYATADYESSGRFAGVNDISALSHEVAEWQDDPFGTNPTKAWGNIGQVTGCQTNLEVGDPLSGTTIPTVTNGRTFHPQELAFFSWFYHSAPSLGVNGLFSNNGTFTTSAPACH
ncbi:MAG TPA: hypothetical protein VHL51_07120 [Gaiellales bacterium]|nr:hypothetical protein [Gaiellales bacterium]